MSGLLPAGVNSGYCIKTIPEPGYSGGVMSTYPHWENMNYIIMREF
jgi:hypothetical protein